MFENTEVVRQSATGMRYGPGKSMPTAAAVPTGHGVG